MPTIDFTLITTSRYNNLVSRAEEVTSAEWQAMATDLHTAGNLQTEPDRAYFCHSRARDCETSALLATHNEGVKFY